MNAIVGFSNLMNTDIELSKAERENFTELINTNSDLLLNLINDILDLSRIESGRMSFSFQQYSLNELISTIYQTFQVLMPENVELRMQIPEKSISIPTDKLRLTQVITNFLSNAIKFTQKGYILIGYEYREEGRHVHIFVEDTGIGIPKEKQDAVFWRDTIVKYLTGQNIWQKFLENTQKWEGQILASLCIFMLISLLLSLYMPQQENMQKITQTGSLFCAAYIIGKEIVEEGFRKWFLKKLKNN